MRKLCWVICTKYRKLERPKLSYLLEKTLVLSIICSNCKNEYETNVQGKTISSNIKNSLFN